MLRSLHRALSALLAAVLVVTIAPFALAGGTVATAAASGELATLPSEDPADWTPNVLDGQVLSVWQVGNTTIIGGTFTEVQNSAANGGATFTRNNIAAFNSTTGALLAFHPTLTDSSDANVNNDVEVVIDAGDGSSVFIGGQFNKVNGENRRKVARVDLATGNLLPFNTGGVNGRVKDLRLIDGTLYVAGLFTSVGASSREYLATLDPDTGAVTDKVDLSIAGVNKGGATRVIKMEATPDGDHLFITGNFDEISGQTRDQVALLDISGATATLTGWSTDYFEPLCPSDGDHYTRDIDVSEDGTFVLVATIGAYQADGPCDTVSRFELTSLTSGIDPTWVTFSGGDSMWSVEIHDGVAYVGGHLRWVNNPFGDDVRRAGGIERRGMAALDLATGLPFEWNPGRDRGVGLFDWHVTAAGIWAVSDTEEFGGEQRERLAFFPWAGGRTVSNPSIGELPNAITQLGRLSGSTGTDDTTVLYRVNAGGPALPAADDGPDWEADTGGGSSYVSGDSSPYTAPDGLATPVNDDDAPKADLDRPHAQIWTTQREGDGFSNMTWSFPIASPFTAITVRLYFANRDPFTDMNAQREFDVTIDGNTVMTDFDATERVGDDIGTMRSFNVNNENRPTVEIEFIPDLVLDNPMISAIELVLNNVTPDGTNGSQDDVIRHEFDGTDVTDSTTAPGQYRWSQVRGAFEIDGKLYTFHNDGQLMVRDVTGSTLGAGTTVDMWSNTIIEEAADITGAFFDPETSRLYYTKTGSGQLFSRGFLVDTMTIDAESTSLNPSGLDAMRVRGMFLGGDGRLYYADSGTGDLRSIAYANGNTSGSSALVDDSRDYRSRGLIRSSAPQPNRSIVPVTPGRILETRPGLTTVDGQAQGQGVVAADGVVELQVAGRAGVPADADAAWINVTAVGPAANGFLTLYPCDEPRPLAANVNYQPGGNYPNAVLAKLDATGKTCIYTKSATHIVADINGFVPDDGSPNTVLAGSHPGDASGSDHRRRPGTGPGRRGRRRRRRTPGRRTRRRSRRRRCGDAERDRGRAGRQRLPHAVPVRRTPTARRQRELPARRQLPQRGRGEARRDRQDLHLHQVGHPHRRRRQRFRAGDGVARHAHARPHPRDPTRPHHRRRPGTGPGRRRRRRRRRTPGRRTRRRTRGRDRGDAERDRGRAGRQRLPHAVPVRRTPTARRQRELPARRQLPQRGPRQTRRDRQDLHLHQVGHPHRRRHQRLRPVSGGGATRSERLAARYDRAPSEAHPIRQAIVKLTGGGRATQLCQSVQKNARDAWIRPRNVKNMRNVCLNTPVILHKVNVKSANFCPGSLERSI